MSLSHDKSLFMNSPAHSFPRSEVVSNPDILGGMPCVAGTRVPAQAILTYLRNKASRIDIFVDYPSLPQDGIEAVVRWAAKQGIHAQVPD